MVDVMSSFDPITYGGVFSDLFIWLLPFMSVFLLGELYLSASGAGSGWFFISVFKVVDGVVGVSRLSFLGMSRLMLSSLFLLMFYIGVGGLVPYIPNISANGAFVFTMGLCFWLGMLLSSWSWAGTAGSLSTLVKDLENKALVGFFYWMEKLSAMLRIITLSVRFTVNMMVGQLIVIGWGSYVLYLYWGMVSWSHISWVYLGFCLLFGSLLIVLELVIVFIQVYLFCMLLGLYGDDHCL